MIAGSLQGVVTQTLLPTTDGQGRVAALEILIPDDAIRNLIRQGKVEQIYSYMQTGSRSGMQTMEQSLADLVATRRHRRRRAQAIEQAGADRAARADGRPCSSGWFRGGRAESRDGLTCLSKRTTGPPRRRPPKTTPSSSIDVTLAAAADETPSAASETQANTERPPEVIRPPINLVAPDPVVTIASRMDDTVGGATRPQGDSLRLLRGGETFPSEIEAALMPTSEEEQLADLEALLADLNERLLGSVTPAVPLYPLPAPGPSLEELMAASEVAAQPPGPPLAEHAAVSEPVEPPPAAAVEAPVAEPVPDAEPPEAPPTDIPAAPESKPSLLRRELKTEPARKFVGPRASLRRSLRQWNRSPPRRRSPRCWVTLRLPRSSRRRLEPPRRWSLNRSRLPSRQRRRLPTRPLRPRRSRRSFAATSS